MSGGHATQPFLTKIKAREKNEIPRVHLVLTLYAATKSVFSERCQLALYVSAPVLKCRGAETTMEQIDSMQDDKTNGLPGGTYG